MTKNQIEYAKLLETNRANLAQEELTRKRDTGQLELGHLNLGETRRSNMAREVETAQHNRATESLDSSKLGETSRHNAQQEALEAMKLSENSRHNRAQEVVALQEADTRRAGVDETRRSNLAKEAETQRSNLAREIETQRSNVARETETNRSNTAQEALGIAAGVTAAARLAEDVRQHLAREGETARHNMAMEIRPVPNAYVNVTNSQNANPYVNTPQGNTNVSVTPASTNVAVEVPTSNSDNGNSVWPRNVVQAVDYLVEDIQSLGSKLSNNSKDNRNITKNYGGNSNGKDKKRKR